jgi:hypothetical protein
MRGDEVSRRAGHSAWCALVLIVVAAACDGLSPDSGEPMPRAFGGNAQITPDGTELPSPITVRVTTPRGRPLAGIPVAWSAGPDEVLAPIDVVTNDSGFARASWTLAAGTGEHYATALVSGREIPFRARATEPPHLGAVQRFSLLTFESSGELVHPDVVRVPRGWAPARRFLAITPYPGGNSASELPSIYQSGASAEWAAPEGLVNPVVRPPRKAYLSDPDVVFNAERRELWLYYRQVTRDNTILLVTSPDGVRWSKPVVVVKAPNHQIVSPSVVRMGPGDWHMWSVNAGNLGCSAATTTVEHRTSSDGIHWSSAAEVSMGNDTLPAWHIDVNWIPEHQQYWALYNGKPGGTCATPAVFLATSSDGVTWETRPNPVIVRGVTGDFRDLVYRSTLEYDHRTDVVTLWYSGAAYREETNTWIWRAAVERMSRAQLFDGVAPSSARRIRIPLHPVPALLRAP